MLSFMLCHEYLIVVVGFVNTFGALGWQNIWRFGIGLTKSSRDFVVVDFDKNIFSTFTKQQFTVQFI